jgi:hypothetical protein
MRKKIGCSRFIKDHNGNYIATEVAGNTARDTKAKARLHSPVGRVHHLIKATIQRVGAGTPGQLHLTTHTFCYLFTLSFDSLPRRRP